jgi:D-ribulokinase
VTDVVIGIDVGTSGVRAVATDATHHIRAMATHPLAAQTPDAWWTAVAHVLKALDLKGIRVRAIAVDGTSGTIISTDANGAPTSTPSMYNEVAATALVARVQKVSPPHTAARGSTSPLSRALAMPQSTHLLHQADWIAGKLAGTFGFSDENNALKTGYDPVTRQWPDWISETGLNMQRLPRVVAAGTAIGKIDPAVAARFNFEKDVTIIAGTTDGCAAFLASGANQAGDGVTSLGTTLTLKLLSANPVFAPEFGIYSHRIGEQWLAGGASNSGGAVLKYLFTDAEIAQHSVALKPDQPTGLDYYPLTKAGERFPINDPHLAPRLTPRPQDDAIFFQAILEGMANIEATAYRKLAELGASPLRSIRTVGGGASNAGWSAIRKRALAVPERASASEHAAAGTARLAWKGIGYAH